MKIFKRIVVTVLYIAFAAILAYLAIAIVGLMATSALYGAYVVLAIAVSTLLGYYISVIAHEGGHLIFGLIAGYKFSSFRIGSLMILKRQGKYSLKKYSLAGTGGQCLMIPPSVPESKFKLTLYNLGGVFVNLAVGCIAFLLYWYLPTGYLLETTLWMTTWFSFVFAALNGIPMKASGLANDGKNALNLRKDKVAANALRTQLLINSEIAAGKRLKDIPEEYFTLPEGADVGNELVSAIAVYSCNRLVDECNFDAAMERMNGLLNGGAKLLGLYRWLLVNDCIFIHLLNGDEETAKAFINKEQARFMKAMKNNPGVIRTSYAIALVLDKDVKKAEKAEQKLRTLAKSYPYPEELGSEIELVELFKSKENIAE